MNHPHGSFCFAELHTPQVDLAKRIYHDVFGWDAVDVPASPGYSLFQLNGNAIVGLRRTDGPHRWVPYIAVDSVDRMAARAEDAGGTVETAPFDTPGVARTCVIQDPDGGLFGLWEYRGRTGADVQNDIATMWWVELLARDVKAARAFYAGLFGWPFEETLKFSEIPYTVFRIGEEFVAGASQYDPEWGMTQSWRVLFAIDDWDATIARLVKSGSEVVFWRDVPHAGRFGIIRDPECADFCVMKPLPRS